MAFWPSSEASYNPPARSRQFIAFTACLLTGPLGVAGPDAKDAWAGVQAASKATSAQTQYLAAVGASETVGSVTPFANALVQQHCDLILAVGAVEVEVVQAVAAANPDMHFVLVAGGSAGANVAVVPGASTQKVVDRVASVVELAVAGTFHGGLVA